ncbi:MAG: hypothetical protein WBD99_16875 [Thermodesulfobacteriota bacterium]
MSSEIIETDSYDRELFSELEGTSKELQDLIDRGSNLVPDFRSLVLDLFASFYKLNVLIISRDGNNERFTLGRMIIEMAHSSGTYKSLRDETVLDGFKSAAATLILGEELIKWIKSDEGISKKTLLREWEISAAVQSHNDYEEQLKTWEEIDKAKSLENMKNKKLRHEKKNADFKLNAVEGELKDLIKEQKEILAKFDKKIEKQIQSSLAIARDRVEEAEDEIRGWGSSMGIPVEKALGKKIDLASKLIKSEKLRKLSNMVGSLKEEMLTSRRKVWSKTGSEVYNVSNGSDLGRIIPSELLTLSHKLLRKDFMKRFIEEKLLQYYLRLEKGRGPLVVCLDGSSSMSGDKEIWSKAVCMTLLDYAKRQRRKFRVIVYSSKGSPLKYFESKVRNSWGMSENDIIELAEYFPGGGTDFQDPLDKASVLLSLSKFKKGDVVFITDGECDVGDEWLNGFLELKHKLKFKIYSVLIDLTGRESPEALKKFSDRITTVSRLTSKDMKEVFISLD